MARSVHLLLYVNVRWAQGPAASAHTGVGQPHLTIAVQPGYAHGLSVHKYEIVLLMVEQYYPSYPDYAWGVNFYNGRVKSNIRGPTVASCACAADMGMTVGD